MTKTDKKNTMNISKGTVPIQTAHWMIVLLRKNRRGIIKVTEGEKKTLYHAQASIHKHTDLPVGFIGLDISLTPLLSEISMGSNSGLEGSRPMFLFP